MKKSQAGSVEIELFPTQKKISFQQLPPLDTEKHPTE